jgi:L-threonylcarbamoyladenylate synthase
MPRLAPVTDESIREAATILRSHRVVAFPTETVYGLGADAFSAAAVSRIFAMKGRPADNPIIVHVIDALQAKQRVAGSWSERCDLLAARFWPGPLTLVVPRSAHLPEVVVAGRDTVAIRSPRHPVARRLLVEVGRPIAAPSANRSGHVSPTTAAHVAADFDDVADLLILDGGPCEIGIESTVLDMTADPPRLLRHGSITTDMLRDEFGRLDETRLIRQDAGPGTAARHYAPRTRTALGTTRDVLDALNNSSIVCVAVVTSANLARGAANPRSSVIVMPDDPQRYAARLYGALREADARGADVILIESPRSRDGLWASIRDRIERACAPRLDETEDGT